MTKYIDLGHIIPMHMFRLRIYFGSLLKFNVPMGIWLPRPRI